MRLRPLQGSTQRGPPTSLLPTLRRATKSTQSATLMEFLPLRRLSPSESTPRRLATPTTFRPQGFTPSRRLPPRSNARPCFMPVTSMGFSLQGFSLAVRSIRLVTRWITLLAFSPPHRAVNSAMSRHPLLRKPNQGPASRAYSRLQGFAPTVNPYRRWTVTSDACGRSPPELSPPLQGLANVFRPRRASVSHSCALTSSSSNSQPRDEPETDLRDAGVRFSGFA